MALRRGPFVICVVLAIALGTASAAGAARVNGSREAAAYPHGSITHSDARSTALRRFAASAGGGRPDDGRVQTASLCWERDYTDPVGDAPIDATAFRLTYDCQSQAWRFSVTLSAPVDTTRFDSLAIEIDTDNDPNDGCTGFDYLIAGVFGSNGVPKAEFVATPNCDPHTWSPVSTAGFSVSGTEMALTYSQQPLAGAARIIWNAGVVPKAQSDPIDDLPDQGTLVADHFLPQSSANDGYLLVDAAGGVHAYGNARFHGDLAGVHLSRPIVGIAAKPDHGGYWLLGRDGGIFSFGHTSFYGSTGNLRLNKPVVSMTATTTGKGYWLVASDGGIFSFGDAAFHGSTGALHLNRPIVGMATTATGKGYWLVASDGGIFSFGDAAFHGSTGALHLNRPIVGMATTATGKGYWLVASDGGIFSFGDAAFHGSTGALRLVSPIVGMTASPTGKGYRFVASDGGIFGFGDAEFFGGLGGGKPPSPVVGMG